MLVTDGVVAQDATNSEFVIPGRDKVASPESISQQVRGQMDSGLAAARCPGMTVARLLRRLPRRTGEPQQRVVGDRLDRREVAMRDVVRPRRGADVVRDRVQRQIDDLARIGRDVAARPMHQIAVEHQHAAGLAGRRDDAALLDEAGSPSPRPASTADRTWFRDRARP